MVEYKIILLYDYYFYIGNYIFLDVSIRKVMVIFMGS